MAGSIRENLIDSFSARFKVFVVTSFDCRIGTDQVLNKSAATAKCNSDYSTREIDKALAYVGAESFEVLPNHRPPKVLCAAAPDVERHPSFWYQQSKTRRCYDAVERYEQSSGECFDWIVRARPDDVWKEKAPAAVSLPREVISTGAVWGFLADLANARACARSCAPGKTNYTAMEDHFMASPRALAGTAFTALQMWHDCRPTAEYERVCPPNMLHFDGHVAPLMQSECLLGLHLREHGVRWRVDRRFQYIMRRVPPRENLSLPYTRMLASMAHLPGRWNATSHRVTTGPHHLESRALAHYVHRERAVEVHRWGEDLHVPEAPPGAWR